MEQEIQQQPQPQIPPVNKNKTILIVVVGIVAAVLVVGAGVYFFINKSPNQPIQNSQNNTPNKEGSGTPVEEQTPAPANINAGFEILYNTVVKPFYLARVQGDEQLALSYLGGNIGSGKYSSRKDIFTRLEGEGWKLINPSFKSFAVVYGGINPREVSNKNAGNFVMRIKKADGTSQDELIYVYKFPDEPSTSTASIDYNTKGYSVINYQATPYLVLQTLERSSPIKTKILLTTKYFKTGCSGYVSSDCTVFSEIENLFKPLSIISEIGQSSLFGWSNTNPNEVVYKKSFGEGGGAYESIESMDINSGTIKEIIKRNEGEMGIDDIFSSTARETAKQECDYILSWERSNKSDDYVEFFECKIKGSSGYNLYLVFNNKIIKKELLSDVKGNEFLLDIEKNIYNIGQFAFSFRGTNYLLNIKTGELKQN